MTAVRKMSRSLGRSIPGQQLAEWSDVAAKERPRFLSIPKHFVVMALFRVVAWQHCVGILINEYFPDNIFRP